MDKDMYMSNTMVLIKGMVIIIGMALTKQNIMNFDRIIIKVMLKQNFHIIIISVLI